MNSELPPFEFYQDFEESSPSIITNETSHKRISKNNENEGEKEKKTGSSKKKSVAKKARAIACPIEKSETSKTKKKSKPSEKKKSGVIKKTNSSKRISCSKPTRNTSSAFKNAIRDRSHLLKRQNRLENCSNNEAPDLSLAMIGLMTAFTELSKMIELQK